MKKLAIVMMTGALTLAAMAGGFRHRPVVVQTFEGAVTYNWTNTYGSVVSIAACYLTGSSANWTLSAVNVSGYTNTLATASTATSLTYTDGTGPVCIQPGAHLIVGCSVTNPVKMTLYLLDDEFGK